MVTKKIIAAIFINAVKQKMLPQTEAALKGNWIFY